ncbi:MAG: hypothetical protein M1814_002597 [Vezdaea aestivalis]|nr:MAG: hypothetical protein M1814_002597 [Vezdaea aestivalis]
MPNSTTSSILGGTRKSTSSNTNRPRSRPTSIFRSQSRHKKGARSVTSEKTADQPAESPSHQTESDVETASVVDAEESQSPTLYTSQLYKLDSSLPVPASLRPFLETSEDESQDGEAVAASQDINIHEKPHTDGQVDPATVDDTTIAPVGPLVRHRPLVYHYGPPSHPSCEKPLQHSPQYSSANLQRGFPPDPRSYWGNMPLAPPPIDGDGRMQPPHYTGVQPDPYLSGWGQPRSFYRPEHQDDFANHPLNSAVSSPGQGIGNLAPPPVEPIFAHIPGGSFTNEPVAPLRNVMDMIRGLSETLPQMQYMIVEHQRIQQELANTQESKHLLEISLSKKEEQIEHVTEQLKATRESLEQELTKRRMETADLREKCVDLEENTSLLNEKCKESHEMALRSKEESMEAVAHIKEKAKTAVETKSRAMREELNRIEQVHEDTQRTNAAQHVQKIQELTSSFDSDSKRAQDEHERSRQASDEVISEMRRLLTEEQSQTKALRDELFRIQQRRRGPSNIVEIKPKGDEYYTDAFQSLRQQILQLSATEFKSVPSNVGPIPQNSAVKALPDFLGNTPSSIELRGAYVSNVISRKICDSVFQPFLFSLGEDGEKADRLLQRISEDMREKSVASEMIWRQHTLSFAYSISGAKKVANETAIKLIDKITSHIRFLIVPERKDPIFTALKCIIKLATETWRHARLENALFSVKMLPQRPIVMADIGPCDNNMDQSILQLIPKISRGPGKLNGPQERDPGYVYLEGEMLYSTATCVLQRLQEVGSNISPTNEGRGNSTPIPIKMHDLPPSLADVSLSKMDHRLQSPPTERIKALALEGNLLNAGTSEPDNIVSSQSQVNPVRQARSASPTAGADPGPGPSAPKATCYQRQDPLRQTPSPSLSSSRKSSRPPLLDGDGEDVRPEAMQNPYQAEVKDESDEDETRVKSMWNQAGAEEGW